MSTITVRQAVYADLEALAELFDLYRMSQGKASALPAARIFLQARFDHGESVVFMAQENSVPPLGFAQIYPSYSSTAMARVFILNDLFVHERGRRKGVASKLLSAVEATRGLTGPRASPSTSTGATPQDSSFMRLGAGAKTRST